MENQIHRDTTLFEELSGEVTVTDPTHPLYGQTLPLLTVRVNRSKTHVTVLLPTGRRRSVPRSATDLEHPAEEATPDPPLPVISGRTILPLPIKQLHPDNGSEFFNQHLVRFWGEKSQD